MVENFLWSHENEDVQPLSCASVWVWLETSYFGQENGELDMIKPQSERGERWDEKFVLGWIRDGLEIILIKSEFASFYFFIFFIWPVF